MSLGPRRAPAAREWMGASPHCNLLGITDNLLLETGTYSFHPEATAAIHHLKEIVVLLAAEPVEPRNLKVGPEVTHVVLFTLHSLGVDGGRGVPIRVVLQDFLGEIGVLVLLLLGV